MKKLRAFLALCVAFILLFVTGTSVYTGGGLFAAPAGQPKKIIYVFKTTLGDIEFWRTVSDGIAIGAKEYGFEYSILGSTLETDVEGNIEAMRRAIAMKPDAIVLVASDYDALAPSAKKCTEEGILLLTMDCDVAGDYARTCIATDNVEIGCTMARQAIARLPDGGTVGIISHVENTQTAIDREAGIQQEFAGHDGYTLLPPVWCDNRIARARTETLAILEEYPDISAFIATNELAANGMCQAIAAAGLGEEITVITCDNSSGQIAYLEQGVIDATVVQKPFNMGYYSVVFTNGLLQDRNDASIPAFYDTGSEVITLENYFTLENQKLLFPLWEE